MSSRWNRLTQCAVSLFAPREEREASGGAACHGSSWRRSASVIAGGPAPLIAAALFAEFKSGYVIAAYILVCAIISLVATSMLKDYTNKDISREYH